MVKENKSNGPVQNVIFIAALFLVIINIEISDLTIEDKAILIFKWYLF